MATAEAAPPTLACDATARVPASRRSRRPTPKITAPWTPTVTAANRKSAGPAASIAETSDCAPFPARKSSSTP